MEAVKRKYDAPVRRQQAAATKQRIAAAAAAEFAAQGWAGTTVAAVAARAEVTPQAVHLAVGTKAALLVRAVEVAVAGEPDEVMLVDRPSFADVHGVGVSAARRLAALAAAAADIYDRAADLFLVLEDAARSDATVAALAEQAGQRRLSDHRALAALLLPDAPDQAVDELTDAIWVLAGPGVYVNFVRQRGWPTARYQRWLTARLNDVLRAARHGAV